MSRRKPPLTPEERTQQRFKEAERVMPTSQVPPIQSDSGACRIIFGRIHTGSGAASAGGGFSVTVNATGDVTITFSTAFSGAPVVVATPDASLVPVAAVTYGAPTTSGVRILVFNTTSYSNVNDNINFIAVGPA